jgi:hypothetical protein
LIFLSSRVFAVGKSFRVVASRGGVATLKLGETRMNKDEDCIPVRREKSGLAEMQSAGG